MGYWDATTGYMKQHGHGPTCPSCGEEMFPQDDHGRFACFCNMRNTLDVVSGARLTTPAIPQVNTSGMSNEEKALVPPIVVSEVGPMVGVME